MITYRSDVDGLRAISVAAVVLFHAGLPAVSGGFVGVDIFFVISGFLITSLIVADADRGTFSVLAFYDRRIRRIFPALFAVLAFVSITGFLVFMPFDLRRIGMQLVATSSFASNILFWLQAGYFNADSQLKPLLHTWSLAVEEQYYIVYPLLLALLLRRARDQLFHILAGLAAASFLLSNFQVEHAPVAAFYLPAGRAWELLMGGLVALRPARSIRLEIATPLAMCGLVLIAAACTFLAPDSAFPGWRALLPCLGAIAIIVAGQQAANPVTLLLSHPVLVGLGVISYSLYLWHWPLLVFARYLALRDLTPLETTGIVLLSVLAAVLSWRYIEQPFRGRSASRPERWRTLFAGTGAALAALVLGAVFYASNGLPARLDPATRQLAIGSFDTIMGRSPCEHKAPADIKSGHSCRIGAPDQPPSYAVFSDSIGIAMMPAFDATGVTLGRAGVDLSRSGCYPLPGVRQLTHGNAYLHDCTEHAETTLAYIKANPAIRTVLVVSRWTSAAEAGTYGEEGASGWFIVDDKSKAPSYAENRAVLQRGIERLQRDLADREVIFVVGAPEHWSNVPRRVALVQRHHRALPIALAREDYDQRQMLTRAIFDAAARTTHLKQLDLAPALCTATDCPTVADGRVLYSDAVHLTRFGALRLVPFLAAALSHD